MNITKSLKKTFPNLALFTLAMELENLLSDCHSVLDLGCGSMGNSYDHDVIQHARDFEPWLCRALHELGIKVIGIDSGKFRNSLKIRH